MPRKPIGPRLYLRTDGDRKVWIIRDNGRDTRTGYGEDQHLHAEKAFANYMADISQTVKLPVGMGFIYFVTCLGSTNYPIKIGWSATPPSTRLNQLQNGNPNLLTVAATLAGSMGDERSLHLYFRHLHIRGEWFMRGDDLIDYIGGLPGHSEVYGDEEFSTAHGLRTEITDRD